MSNVTFHINRGTRGKLIELIPDGPPIIKDWTLRKDFVFRGCLINPTAVQALVKSVSSGYALFGGDSGRDRHARFFFAVKYHQIKVVPVDPNS